ncbi:hypothetical protein GCM10009799_31260 [Nocardiopsis rhodophaea]|uniref:HEAT repeat domain-containing protein n=1 Tax=Nocardiopsis rhodophaea TaxID=280238 RepID=A0ABN2T8N4_9ACTN
MRYFEPEDVERDALERALRHGGTDAICSSLIGLVFHDGNWKWLQDTCLGLLTHESASVRKCAVTSLGHIARIHRALETDVVVPRLEALRSNTEIGGTANDALEDISIFLA